MTKQTKKVATKTATKSANKPAAKPTAAQVLKEVKAIQTNLIDFDSNYQEAQTVFVLGLIATAQQAVELGEVGIEAAQQTLNSLAAKHKGTDRNLSLYYGTMAKNIVLLATLDTTKKWKLYSIKNELVALAAKQQEANRRELEREAKAAAKEAEIAEKLIAKQNKAAVEKQAKAEKAAKAASAKKATEAEKAAAAKAEKAAKAAAKKAEATKKEQEKIAKAAAKKAEAAEKKATAIKVKQDQKAKQSAQKAANRSNGAALPKAAEVDPKASAPKVTPLIVETRELSAQLIEMQQKQNIAIVALHEMSKAGTKPAKAVWDSLLKLGQSIEIQQIRLDEALNK